MTELWYLNDLASLERAWWRSLRWARDVCPFFNACEAEAFVERLTQELLVIQGEIVGMGYAFSPYLSLQVPKPHGGKRTMSFPRSRDAIVAQWLLDVIGPEVAKRIPECAHAYRFLDASTKSDRIFNHWAVCYSKYSSAVEKFLTLPPKATWVKTDIKTFYDTIDQAILLRKLGNILRDELQLLELAGKLIHYEVEADDGTVDAGRGLPTGPAYSHLLANYYLAELDEKWATKALAYARYVDDIVMVFGQGSDVDELLCEFDSDLCDIGLKRNLSKTIRGDIENADELIDKVKKMKYRIALLAGQDEGEEEGEEELGENLRELFNKTLWDLEDVDEITKVTPHLRFVFGLLHRKSAEQQRLVALAYIVLCGGLADPVLCRLALLLIVRESIYSVDDRFISMIEDEDYLAQATFLRLVIEEEGVDPPVDKIVKLTYSRSIVVRTLAFAALQSRDVCLDGVALTDMLTYQTEHYADTHSIEATYAYAARAVVETQTWSRETLWLLSSLASKGIRPSALAVVELMSVVADGTLVSLFWRGALDAGRTSALVRLLNACLSSGALSLAKQVIEVAGQWWIGDSTELFRLGIRTAYQIALSRGDVILLAKLADWMQSNLGEPYDDILHAESVLGLREATQVEDVAFAQGALPLLETALKQDPTSPLCMHQSTPAIDVQGVKYVYGSSILSSADSSVSLFEMVTVDGVGAVLETVSKNVLTRVGFETLESWKGYLGTLRSNGVTFASSSIEYKGFVFTVYHVPEGFYSLRSIAGDLVSEEEASIFDLAARIGAAVQLTKWAHGKFQSIGPSTVYTDLARSIKFVGLALSGVAPVYGAPGPRRLSDNSSEAYQLCLSLLAGEILFGDVHAPREEPLVFLERQDRKIARPFRYIWLRLAASDPEYRYNDWSMAEDDITHAKAIQEGKKRMAACSEAHVVDIYELGAFLDFRLSVTRRNPRLKNDALRDYAHAVVDQYLKEAQRTFAEPTSDKLLDPFAKRRLITISSKDRHGLLFICRVLVGLADGYWELYEANEILRTVARRNVALDLLLSVVWLEAESVLKSLAVHSALSDNRRVRELVQTLQTAACSATAEIYSKIEVIPPGDTLSPISLSEVITQDNLIYLVDTLAGICDHPSHDANQLNFATANQLRLLAWVLAGRLSLTTPMRQGSVDIGLAPDTAQGYEWSQSFGLLVNLLHPDYAGASHDSRMKDVCSETAVFIKACRQLRPFERKMATVLRYNYVLSEGKVRFRRGLRLHDRYFDHTAIGAASWERSSDTLVPCTVDLRNDEHGKASPMRVSVAPHKLLRLRRGRWRYMALRIFSPLQKRVGDTFRKWLRWSILLISVGFIVWAIVSSLWSLMAVPLFFATSFLWRWIEYLLFKGR